MTTLTERQREVIRDIATNGPLAPRGRGEWATLIKMEEAGLLEVVDFKYELSTVGRGEAESSRSCACASYLSKGAYFAKGFNAEVPADDDDGTCWRCGCPTENHGRDGLCSSKMPIPTRTR